jgi:hypothetical protein
MKTQVRIAGLLARIRGHLQIQIQCITAKPDISAKVHYLYSKHVTKNRKSPLSRQNLQINPLQCDGAVSLKISRSK